jgi:hypothetical protein
MFINRAKGVPVAGRFFHSHALFLHLYKDVDEKLVTAVGADSCYCSFPPKTVGVIG